MPQESPGAFDPKEISDVYTPEFLERQALELAEHNREIIAINDLQQVNKFYLDVVPSHFQEYATLVEDAHDHVVDVVADAPVAVQVARRSMVLLFDKHMPGFGGAKNSDEQFDYEYWMFRTENKRYHAKMTTDRYCENGVMPVVVQISHSRPEGYDNARQAQAKQETHKRLTTKRVGRSALRAIGNLGYAVKQVPHAILGSSGVAKWGGTNEEK